MKPDQYLADMHDGVDAAHKAQSPTSVTVTEATRLHKSINAPVDPERLKDDTIFRTDGKCGASKPERVARLRLEFSRLNQGKDGG